MRLRPKKHKKEALFGIHPRILFDPQKKFALMWSAKAGCTFLTKWFFAQANLLKTALRYDPWIHKYRDEVFFLSDEYRNNVHGVINGDYKIIKVVRNPFSRAVSSYLTAIFQATKRNENPAHLKVKASLEEFLKRKLTDETTFSFREFVDYLETIDILTCNIHHRQQLHPLEIKNVLNPTHIADLNQCQKHFKQLEKDLNLNSVEMEQLRDSPHHTRRVTQMEFCGDIKYKWKRHATYPSHRSFYDEKLSQKIARIYEMDFDAYGYEKETNGK